MQLTDLEYQNIVAQIQFLQNKSERLEREKKEIIEACQIMLIGNKNGDITLFPRSDKTPDYLQIIEDKINEII